MLRRIPKPRRSGTRAGNPCDFPASQVYSGFYGTDDLLMKVLGIETTCDETGIALVEDGRKILVNRVLSQVPLHERFGGVVPEIASRAHVETITRMIEAALADAGIPLPPHRALDAVAVAFRPGLVGSLLVGVTAAKCLSWAWDLPLVGVDHLHAHIY